MGAIRGAAGNERKGDDGKTGSDNFFHKGMVSLMVDEQPMMLPPTSHRHGVKP